MKPLVLAVLLALPAAAQPVGRGIVNTANSPHVKLKALDVDEVRWTGGFWAERFDTVRQNTLPVLLSALENPENGAQYSSFLKLAKRGGDNLNLKRLNWWSDGDVYKTVEAMALAYASTKDPAIDRRMDEMISAFAAAQEPDGYISTPIQLRGADRWQNLNHHELYNMGHLMTAACIHYRMTGKKNFLDIAVKVGDYLYATFQPRPKNLAHFGFNPSNIMGAVELYRTTGEPKVPRTRADIRGYARLRSRRHGSESDAYAPAQGNRGGRARGHSELSLRRRHGCLRRDRRKGLAPGGEPHLGRRGDAKDVHHGCGG